MKYYKSPRTVKFKTVNGNEKAPEGDWVEVDKDGTPKESKSKTTKKEK